MLCSSWEGPWLSHAAPQQAFPIFLPHPSLRSALMVVYFIWNLVAIPTVAVVHRKKPKSKTAAAGEGAADAGKAGTGAEGEGVDAKAE